MPIFVLSIFIQVCFVVHIVKTGRNTRWIWIVVMLPVAGAIAYLLLEVLPEAFHSRSGRKAGRKVRAIINPNKNINEAAEKYAMADTVRNSVCLAEQCLGKGKYAEAKVLYTKCLTGVHSSDPDMMFGLAQADFGLGDFLAAKQTLDALIELNPDYKNQHAHLLYARTLERLDDPESARHEYEALREYFTGPQAIYYYAHFLQSQGKRDKAGILFTEISEKSSRSGRHYNDLYKDYIRKARHEIE